MEKKPERLREIRSGKALAAYLRDPQTVRAHIEQAAKSLRGLDRQLALENAPVELTEQQITKLASQIKQKTAEEIVLPYFSGIVRNSARKAARRKRPQTGLADVVAESDAQPQRNHEDNLELSITQKRTAQRIIDAMKAELAKMPFEHRRILFLKHAAEKTHKEIAGQTPHTAGTIKEYASQYRKSFIRRTQEISGSNVAELLLKDAKTYPAHEIWQYNYHEPIPPEIITEAAMHISTLANHHQAFARLHYAEGKPKARVAIETGFSNSLVRQSLASTVSLLEKALSTNRENAERCLSTAGAYGKTANAEKQKLSLSQALARLTQEQRTILRLRLKGKKYSEVSQTLGLKGRALEGKTTNAKLKLQILTGLSHGDLLEQLASQQEMKKEETTPIPTPAQIAQAAIIVAKLSPTQQRAAYLRYAKGRKLEQTATAIGQTNGGTAKTLHNVRLALRQQLGTSDELLVELLSKTEAYPATATWDSKTDPHLKELEQRLAGRIRSLPQRKQHALREYYVEKHSPVDIAKKFAISPQGLDVLLLRTRRELTQGLTSRSGRKVTITELITMLRKPSNHPDPNKS